MAKGFPPQVAMHLGSPLGAVENGVTNIHHKGAMMKLVPVQN